MITGAMTVAQQDWAARRLARVAAQESMDLHELADLDLHPERSWSGEVHRLARTALHERLRRLRMEREGLQVELLTWNG